MKKLEKKSEYAWMNRNGNGFGTQSLMECEIHRAIDNNDPGVTGRPIADPISLFYLRDNRSIIPKNAKKLYQDPHTAASAKTPVRCIGSMCDGKYSKIAGQTIFHVNEERQQILNHLRLKVKELAQKEQLYLIIASTDYIYGTNYQFCHGYIGKDLENLTQEKAIQAIGRVGRKNTSGDYSIRLRNNELIHRLFMKSENMIEVNNMNRLFG